MTLLGGEPGIGKSTLLLQLAGMLVGPAAKTRYRVASVVEGASPGPAAADLSDTATIQTDDSQQQILDKLEASLQLTSEDEDELDEEEPGVLYVSAEESAEQVQLCNNYLSSVCQKSIKTSCSDVR